MLVASCGANIGALGAGNRRFFAWHEVGGKKVGVDAQSDEAKALAKHGDLSVIMVAHDGDKSSIGLIRP